MSSVIKVENISKQYRLGNVGTGSIAHDLNRTWYRVRGKEDPYLKIGEANDRATKGSSDYVWALRDINFEVKQGEVLGIIGRNGAGKSTLLKILSRTTSPTTGEIKIKGRVASLLEVGTGFHPELTGRENIFLNGAILGMSKKEIKSKFDEIVDFAGVERYIDTPVKRYSSGMYVRLAFGVAAHLEPEILIVDEVLAVGDAEFQKKALGKMKDVSGKDGRTVLFVSHNMASMQKLCRNGILLKNGLVCFEGQINETINHYRLLSRESHQIELADRIDRKGSGRLKIVDYAILNENSEVVGSVNSGENFSIEILLEANEEICINDLRVDIGIADQDEKRVCVVSNQIIGQKFWGTGKLFSIRYDLMKMPLNSGCFGLIFYIVVDNELSDWIENAGELVVEEGDFYGTGRINKQHQGIVLMDYVANMKILGKYA